MIGLIPVNHGFQPDPNGVEIIMVSSLTHSDIVLPIQTETINWRSQFSSSQFRGDISDATHIAIGWGDRDFYTQTSMLSKFRISTTLKALFWPSRSCIHVVFTEESGLPKDQKVVKISEKQYEKLVEFIQDNFQVNRTRQPKQIANAAYQNNDAFFETHGYYTMFNTCNNWAGNALKTAGLKTGWYTPLPKSMLLYWST